MNIHVTGTHIWYYYICRREVWLMMHQLQPDEDDENILIGRIIGESTYKRDKKEMDLGSAKLDLIRTENGQVIVGEVKKSSRFVESSTKQLLFYLLQLKEMGINARGELLIPEEKKKIHVLLDKKSETEILKAIDEIKQLAGAAEPPLPQKIKYCRKCAYSEFCWA